MKTHTVSWDEVMLNSEEIKSIALAVIELRLCEGLAIAESNNLVISCTISQWLKEVLKM